MFDVRLYNANLKVQTKTENGRNKMQTNVQLDVYAKKNTQRPKVEEKLKKIRIFSYLTIRYQHSSFCETYSLFKGSYAVF